MSQKIKTIKAKHHQSTHIQSTIPIIIEACKKKDTRFHSDRGTCWITGFKN